jgi:hypothetical protein
MREFLQFLVSSVLTALAIIFIIGFIKKTFKDLFED